MQGDDKGNPNSSAFKRWKVIIVRASACGIACGLAIGTIFWLWAYLDRRPKPWDTKALFTGIPAF
jgi:hypothetical protein